MFDYTSDASAEWIPLNFTGARLIHLLDGEIDVMIDYIQHWHLGRSFFEFVPRVYPGQNSQYYLEVYRDYPDGSQRKKQFLIDMEIDVS